MDSYILDLTYGTHESFYIGESSSFLRNSCKMNRGQKRESNETANLDKKSFQTRSSTKYLNIKQFLLHDLDHAKSSCRKSMSKLWNPKSKKSEPEDSSVPKSCKPFPDKRNKYFSVLSLIPKNSKQESTNDKKFKNYRDHSPGVDRKSMWFGKDLSRSQSYQYIPNKRKTKLENSSKSIKILPPHCSGNLVSQRYPQNSSSIEDILDSIPHIDSSSDDDSMCRLNTEGNFKRERPVSVDIESRMSQTEHYFGSDISNSQNNRKRPVSLLPDPSKYYHRVSSYFLDNEKDNLYPIQNNHKSVMNEKVLIKHVKYPVKMRSKEEETQAKHLSTIVHSKRLSQEIKKIRRNSTRKRNSSSINVSSGEADTPCEIEDVADIKTITNINCTKSNEILKKCGVHEEKSNGPHIEMKRSLALETKEESRDIKNLRPYIQTDIDEKVIGAEVTNHFKKTSSTSPGENYFTFI